MKNKKFKIFLSILVIILITIILYIKFSSTNNNESNNSTQNQTNSNIIIGFNSTNIEQSSINTNGENSTIYVGNESANYMLFSIYINKKNSKEEQGLEIIQNISKKIGYDIKINSLTIKDNKIKIDFDSKYAPITIDGNYNGNYEEAYVTYSDTAVVYTSFDSIYKSLKDYFGQDYEIYFSANKENISLPNISDDFSIDMNHPYEPNNE